MKQMSIFCAKYLQAHAVATGPHLGPEVANTFFIENVLIHNIRRYLKFRNRTLIIQYVLSK